MKRIIGISGGSGIYDLPELKNTKWHHVETAWGKPSDQILTGNLDEVEMVFLPRHGRGHVHPPSSIPYRANIDAFKRFGVTDLISLSACGSFSEEISPGDFVLVDQFIDRTFAREKSFFGKGCVGHVSMAYPVCNAQLGQSCKIAAEKAGIKLHPKGTYLAMEGPQFSSLAESKLYREKWGCDVIGMTGMPEAKLAREAELCYANIAMVTDYDSWHQIYGEIDVVKVIETLKNNVKKAKDMVAYLPRILGNRREHCPQGCDKVLDYAIITTPQNRDVSLVSKLEVIAGRVLK